MCRCPMQCPDLSAKGDGPQIHLSSSHRYKSLREQFGENTVFKTLMYVLGIWRKCFLSLSEIL